MDFREAMNTLHITSKSDKDDAISSYLSRLYKAKSEFQKRRLKDAYETFFLIPIEQDISQERVDRFFRLSDIIEKEKRKKINSYSEHQEMADIQLMKIDGAIHRSEIRTMERDVIQAKSKSLLLKVGLPVCGLAVAGIIGCLVGSVATDIFQANSPTAGVEQNLLEKVGTTLGSKGFPLLGTALIGPVGPVVVKAMTMSFTMEWTEIINVVSSGGDISVMSILAQKEELILTSIEKIVF